MQEAGKGESKAGASVLPGMTRLPAPTLWPLSYCCSFPATAALPTPRLAEMASDLHEGEGSGPKAGFSPYHHSTTSSLSKVPSPTQGPYPQTSDDDATSDVGLIDPSSRKKGRSRGNRGSRSGESSDGSHSTRSTTSSGGRRKKKDGFSSKIQIPEFGGKKDHSGDVTDAFRQ